MIRERSKRSRTPASTARTSRRSGRTRSNFETVFFVLKPDFQTYMDRQQAINLEIHRRFEEHGIEFAYPTQTLYMARAEA
jgi:small-conductance mechanosensitive channel